MFVRSIEIQVYQPIEAVEPGVDEAERPGEGCAVAETILLSHYFREWLFGATSRRRIAGIEHVFAESTRDVGWNKLLSY